MAVSLGAHVCVDTFGDEVLKEESVAKFDEKDDWTGDWRVSLNLLGADARLNILQGQSSTRTSFKILQTTLVDKRSVCTGEKESCTAVTANSLNLNLPHPQP